jgi:hypothetical protein
MGKIVILLGITSFRRGIHRKNFICGLPTLAFHRINSDFAGNYQLIDMESTVRMGFPPGITTSETRTSPENMIPQE